MSRRFTVVCPTCRSPATTHLCGPVLSICASAWGVPESFSRPPLKQHPAPSLCLMTQSYLCVALIWNSYLSTLTPLMFVFCFTPNLEFQGFCQFCLPLPMPGTQQTHTICQMAKWILKGHVLILCRDLPWFGGYRCLSSVIRREDYTGPA